MEQPREAPRLNLRRFPTGLTDYSLTVFLLRGYGVHFQNFAQTRPAASETPLPQPNSHSQRISARRITEPIRIDGRLDEASWSSSPVATNFRQQTPDEGAPASERTEVRVLFDGLERVSQAGELTGVE